MAESKHTPGPLIAVPEQTWWNVKVVGSDKPETYAKTATSTLTAGYCSEADAVLYAAAPALLEALKNTERALEKAVRAACATSDFTPVEMSEIISEHVVIKAARAAIALAQPSSQGDESHG